MNVSPRTPTLTLPQSPGVVSVSAFVILYVALDWVSFVDPVGPLGITPWNPAPGLALFLLLRYGWRFAPWLCIAVIAAEAIVRGAPAPWPVLVTIAAVLTVGYTALGVWLRRRLGFHAEFATLRDVTVFIIAAAVATAIIAFAYVGVFVASGVLPPANFAHSVIQYWVGDLIGVVVTTPALLVATRARAPDFDRSRAEAVAQAAAILIVLWIVFAMGLGEELKLFYVMFLPVIWIAMRRGVAGSAYAALLIQVGVIAVLMLAGHASGEILDFQLLMLVLAPTGLVAGAAVDERVAVERRLRDKQMALDRSLRAAAASELAGALAHELNQPLSAIASYARASEMLLEMGDTAGELRPTLRKVVAEANRAATVLRRLREFVLTGSLRQVRMSVSALLEAAANAARADAQRHRIALSVVVPPSTPDVFGDRVQLETVLHNLINNAVDAVQGANRKGNIRLSASLESAKVVRICVADDGPGVLPELAATLFDPLTSSKADGLGLGLAISRTIIEAHGGRLWFESPRFDAPRSEASAQGTSFCFTLTVAGDAHG